ncbi:YhgE/Pip domain-containing protein, partial [Microbacterium laevaniformans]|uniref:YhgE/Pip domain-containing protein n=1 Tax=Microbacterium laevaniformans TaxID=36807 RepID=UPI003CD05FA9
MIAAELLGMTATRMSVIALIALMLVPVLYGGLYLWANQDPYGHFSEVPVALVDLDEGVGDRRRCGAVRQPGLTAADRRSRVRLACHVRGGRRNR